MIIVKCFYLWVLAKRRSRRRKKNTPKIRIFCYCCYCCVWLLNIEFRVCNKNNSNRKKIIYEYFMAECGKCGFLFSTPEKPSWLQKIFLQYLLCLIKQKLFMTILTNCQFNFANYFNAFWLYKCLDLLLFFEKVFVLSIIEKM